MPVFAVHRPQAFVGGDADTELGGRDAVASGNDHPGGFSEVRRHGMDRGAFGHGLADQVDLPGSEVSQSAVDQFGGTPRCSGGKVVGLDKSDPQPPPCGLAGNAGAGDTSSDHCNIEAVRLEPIEQTRSACGGQAGIVHALFLPQSAAVVSVDDIDHTT